MNNKRRLIILGVILALMLLIAGWLWLYNRDTDLSTNETTSKTEVYDPLARITNYGFYFSIADKVKTLYQYLDNPEDGNILKLYSKTYLKEHEINKDNAKEKLNPYGYSYGAFLTDAYYTCNKYNCHILMNIDQYHEGLDRIIKDNTLIAVLSIDLKNGAYQIEPVDNASNFANFVNSYIPIDKTVEYNKLNAYESIDYTSEYKIQYYLDFVKYIILCDQNKINEYFDGYKASEEINYLNRLSNVLYTFRVSEGDHYEKTEGSLYDGTLFTIADYAPMKFKFAFNN